MPQSKVCVETLELEADQHLADAEDALTKKGLLEMERQILQCGHMERYCNKMLRVATLKGEYALVKTLGDQAAKWATNLRAATTKRRNDEVPKLIQAMENRKEWARTLLGIEEED